MSEPSPKTNIDPIAQAEAVIEAARKARYDGAVNDLRANVFSRMEALGVLRLGGCAIFRLLDHSDELLSRHKEVLLRLQDNGNSLGRYNIATIRILTKEVFIAHKGETWLLEDMTFDQDGDGQYLTDCINTADDPDWTDVWAGVFETVDGTKLYSRVPSIAPTAFIPDANDELPPVFPFGFAAELDGKEYMLSEAERVIEALNRSVPLYTSVNAKEAT